MENLRPLLMDRVRAGYRRLSRMLNPREAEQRMDAELSFHLEQAEEQYRREGLGAADARRAARIAFGSVDRTAEEMREARDIAGVRQLIADGRHAWRGLRRAPGFAVVAVTTLAIGVGVATAVFTVARAVVLAPLPYANADRLIRLWESNRAQNIGRGPVSPGTFVDVAARARSIDGIALYGQRDVFASTDADSFMARMSAVSPSLFDVLGVRPLIGTEFPRQRDPRTNDAGASDVIISYSLWQQHFGGRRDILGRMLRVDEAWAYTIIGVMPRGFAFPEGVDVWTSLRYSPAVSNVERQFRYNGAVAKLARNVSLDAAAHELKSVAEQLQVEYPASNAGWTIDIARLDRAIEGDSRGMLFALLGLAGCVLLIACVNVATLVLARAMARQHELAVRVALGAGRGHLVRRCLADGLLLAAIAMVAGIAVAYATTRLLLARAPSGIPRLDEVHFGGWAFAGAACAAAVTAIFVGVAPALRASDVDVMDAMRTRAPNAGKRSAQIRSCMLVIQVAVAFALVLSATLLARSFGRLQHTDLGYDRHNIVSAELNVPTGQFHSPRPWFLRAQYYEQLEADLARLPGVVEVGGTTNIPLVSDPASGSLWRTDAPGAHGRKPPTSAADQWKAAIHSVTPRYFSTMGVPVMRGRAFAADDRFTDEELTNPPIPRPVGVAIVNQAMATRFFPNEDPLGKQIFLFDDQTFAAYRTIVGVVRDVRSESVNAPPSPTVYLPYAQHPGNQLSFVIRSASQPSTLTPSIITVVHAFDRRATIRSVRTIDEIVGSSLAVPRFAMLLAGSFGALSLAVSAIGVFGIVGYLVTARTQEIGIRLALGARAPDVLRLVFTEGLKPVATGVAAGGIGSLIVARAIRGMLYGVSPFDPTSFVIAAALLLIAAVAAAALPAGRAIRVDPLRSLRGD
jgi:predicted permease